MSARKNKKKYKNKKENQLNLPKSQSEENIQQNPSPEPAVPETQDNKQSEIPESQNQANSESEISENQNPKDSEPEEIEIYEVHHAETSKTKKNNFDHLKSTFDKFLSEFMAPETESDFDFDDSFEDDIFAGESQYSAKNSYIYSEHQKQETVKAESYKTYTDPDPAPIKISPSKAEDDSDGLYADLMKDSMEFPKEPSKFDENTVEKIIIPEDDDIIYSAPESPPAPIVQKQPQSEAKEPKSPPQPVHKQITVADIIRAKEMGIEGQRMTLDLGEREYISPLKLRPNQFTPKKKEKISSSEISAEEIKSETISSPEILSEEIKSETISSPEISSEEIKSETISSPEILSEEIKSETISSPEISSEEIKSETISSPEILSEEIKSETISSPEILSEEIKPETISSPEILSEEIKPETISSPEIHKETPPSEDKVPDYGDMIDKNKLPPIQFNERQEAPQPRKKAEVMRYSVNRAEPFIVMAGKFSSTVRLEYDNIRKYTSSAKTAALNPNNNTQNSENAVKLPIRQTKPKSKESPAAKNEKIRTQPAKQSTKASDIFKSLFSSYAPYENEPTEIPEKKPQLEDYKNTEDTTTVKNEISANLWRILIRTFALGIAAAISIIITAIVQANSGSFANSNKNGWLIYGILNFIILIISLFIGKNPIFNGFLSLKHLKCNAETPISFAAFACTIQAAAGVMLPNVFVNGTYYLYSPLIIITLFLNHLGKFFMLSRANQNFNFFIKPKNRFAGKIYTDEQNVENFTQGLPASSLIAYFKPSRILSNFLQLSYAPDPVEDLAAKIAPFGAIISILGGIIYGIITGDLIGAISLFTLAACITTPMCCLIAVNIPLKNICSNSLKNGAMITGYETVKQFCDTNAVMFDSAQLYPPGSIYINGVKTYNQMKFYDALRAYAAVMVSVNSPVKYAFDKFIPEGVSNLPKVESVVYDEGHGMTAWVNGQRILIGNRSLLEKHGVKAPNRDEEEKRRSEGKEIVYVTVSGELVVMFMLVYKTDMKVARELRNLEDSGVNFIIRNIDPVITEDFIAERFKLYPRCLKILPTGMGNICNHILTARETSSRAYLVTDGKLSSFARAITNCISLKPIIPMLKILQLLSIIIGLIIITAVAFISGFGKLGSLQVIVYIACWCIIAVIVSAIVQKVIK